MKLTQEMSNPSDYVRNEIGELGEALVYNFLEKMKDESDEQIDELHNSYEAKFEKLEEKVRKERRDLDEAEAEQKSRRNDEYFNVVETVFGGIFGGRRRRSVSFVS